MINVVKALGFCSTSSLIRLLLCMVWVGGQGVSMCISGVYVLRLSLCMEWVGGQDVSMCISGVYVLRFLLCMEWGGGQGVVMCISGVYVLRLPSYTFYCVWIGEGV